MAPPDANPASVLTRAFERDLAHHIGSPSTNGKRSIFEKISERFWSVFDELF